MNCSKCNTEMIFFIEGRCCGWKCPNCDASIVTTYYSEIEMDKTEYSISVLAEADNSMAKIRTVSEVLNCNYIQAKTKLSTGFTISSVSAVDATRIIKDLKNVGVLFKTFPEFPHDI